jgi:hypothetical protein
MINKSIILALFFLCSINAKSQDLVLSIRTELFGKSVKDGGFFSYNIVGSSVFFDNKIEMQSLTAELKLATEGHQSVVEFGVDEDLVEKVRDSIEGVLKQDKIRLSKSIIFNRNKEEGFSFTFSWKDSEREVNLTMGEMKSLLKNVMNGYKFKKDASNSWKEIQEQWKKILPSK